MKRGMKGNACVAGLVPWEAGCKIEVGVQGGYRKCSQDEHLWMMRRRMIKGSMEASSGPMGASKIEGRGLSLYTTSLLSVT